jgi:AcrR family transcriptional regulator
MPATAARSSPTRRGDAARAALVEHGERLFAERGIETVSLRDVSAAAGQRNHSAAQYHFGDRQGLLAAVYEARMRRVDERRHAYVAALREAGRIDEVRGLVEAVVLPLVGVVDETGGWYARFLARTRWDPFAWDVLVSLPTSSSFQTVIAGLDRQLRALPTAVRRQRIDQMLTLVIGTLAGWEGAPDRGEKRLARDLLAAELVTTATALLTAPSETLHPATSSHLTGARR